MSKVNSAFAYLIIVAFLIELEVALAGDSAAQASRIAVQTDLINLATKAQQFYSRPGTRRGGGGSFVKLTADPAGMANLTLTTTNPNGTYSICTAGTATSVVLHGEGTEKGANGGPIDVNIEVFADSVALFFNN